MINYHDTDGTQLIDRFYDSLRHHRVKIKDIAKKTGIPQTTVYAYLREPHKAPLGKMMAILRVAEIQQVTLKTGGNYAL